MGLLYLGTPYHGTRQKSTPTMLESTASPSFFIPGKVSRTGMATSSSGIEYMVIAFDDKTKNAKLSLRQTEILAKLSKIVTDLKDDVPDSMTIPTFHPEYGRYMLESTPGSPYTDSIQDLLSVESNMHYRQAISSHSLYPLLIMITRRLLTRRHLNANEVPITITSFPRLGVPGVFTDPYFSPEDAKSSHSLFLPEEITNPHARFPTLTANIRSRRGSKVAINLPIFIDDKTPRPFVDPAIPWQRSLYPEDAEAKNGAALIDHIYMDAMGFGNGLLLSATHIPELQC
ncbi:hypothetical protein JVU11DRAFT_2680 [Chiua virens]|nr:hypothetical protein JVU11DRAFT_2680 [Chiua virens]